MASHLPRWRSGKESACQARVTDLIPGLGRSLGERNGNPLQYSCLENPMDKGAWWDTVHGVAKSRTWLSDWVCTYNTHYLFKKIFIWLHHVLQHMGFYCGTVVQSLSRVQLFATPWTAACQASLSSIISWSLLKLMSIELLMPSNHLILHCPLLLLPSIFPNIRVFSNESAFLIRCPNYWSFSFSISPFNIYSGLISFRIDWFDLLAIQGSLKNLLQHHDLKVSIIWCSACFMV